MNKGLCIYTTIQKLWLDEFLNLSPGSTATFQSVHKWKRAEELLQGKSSVPVLIRASGEDSEPLQCAYIADLVALTFADRFMTKEDKQRWLENNLTLQKHYIQNNTSPKFSTWHAQFESWELDFGNKANTWFMLRNLRRIKPFPITKLVKESNNQPLAPNYIRGYAICYFPEGISELS